jgi:tetratricopeptide (TPR) repeat protein
MIQSPDDAPDFAEPTARLHTFLRSADDGYAICACDSHDSRRDILNSLFAGLANCGVAILNVELEATHTSIPGRIGDALWKHGALPVQFRQIAVSIVGLETYLADADRNPRPGNLRKLVYKEPTFNRFGHPLMFWMPVWLRDIVRTHAPRFWEKRGLSVEFTPETDSAGTPPATESSEQTGQAINRSLARLKLETDPRRRARILEALAARYHKLDARREARKRYDESLSIWRELNDRAREAAVLEQLAAIARSRRDPTEARRLLSLVLAIRRELEDKPSVAAAARQLADLACQAGCCVEARKFGEESLAAARQLGDKPAVVNALRELARTARTEGDNDRARDLYDSCVPIYEELGDRAAVVATLHELADLAESRHDHVDARLIYDRILAIVNEAGDECGATKALRRLAVIAERTNDTGAARRLCEQALAATRLRGDHVGIMKILRQLAGLAEKDGDLAEARRHCEQAVLIARQLSLGPSLVGTLRQLASYAWKQGDHPAARAAYEQVLEVSGDRGDRSGVASALGQLGILADIAHDDTTALRNYLSALAACPWMAKRESDSIHGRIAKLRARLGQEAFDALYETITSDTKQPGPDDSRPATEPHRPQNRR